MTLLVAITGFVAYYFIKKNKLNEEENPTLAAYCKVKIEQPNISNN